MNITKIFIDSEQNIHLANEEKFRAKISNFIKSYKEDKKSVAIITDFDLTITSKYDYKKKQEYKTSYYFYDEDVIDSKETNYYGKIAELKKIYADYDINNSLDLNLRKEKSREWNYKSLLLYKNKKFTLDSIDKMIEARKDVFAFRKGVKEYFELLIQMGIPIVIVSGGITQFIIGALKTIINDLEKLIKEEKILIISNNLLFDGENKSCTGCSENIIYQFNKAESISNFMKLKFPILKDIMVFGDHVGDASSISEINLDKEKDVIGFWFLNVNPDDLDTNDKKKKKCIEENVEEYKKYFDVVLVCDSDYKTINDLFDIINNI